MSLSPTTPLRRADRFHIELDSTGELKVHLEAGSFTCGPHGLALLAAFERPRTLAAALAELRPRIGGAQDWIDLTTTAERLVQAGVLLAAGAEPPAPAYPRGVASLHADIEWLGNEAALAAVLAAVREVVRPGDVVVDFGSRTGLLAITAALAGAARVYALTMGGAGELVAQGAARNGVGDRVTVVQAWPAWGHLPPAADVLVAEGLSYDLAGMRLAALLRDARRRLLGPGGRVVPERMALRARLLRAPEAERLRRTFTPEVVGRWREWYGIDFGPCAAASARAGALFAADPGQVAGWAHVGPELTLCADLIGAAEELDDGRPLTAALSATEAGVFDGAALGCVTQLSPGRRLADALGGAWPRERVWLLPEPQPVAPGERVALTYRRGLPPPRDRLEITVEP